MRPLFDTESIFGIYEPGGEQLMLQAGRSGWIVFSEAIGGDPDDRRGVDFRPFSEQGLGVICRINYGYEPHGTIPHSSQYEAFARRVANFVQTSRGCKIWVIGNEMNYAVERPGIQIDWSRHGSGLSDVLDEADPLHHGLPVRFNVLPDYSDEIRTTRGAIISPGESITPNLYARCYQLCRTAIQRLPGHEEDQVLVGAVAPWNTQTTYPGNPNGDWVQYFRDILALLGPKSCDGFALHTYTHGADPAQITSDVKLPPPFQNRHLEFRAFQDFMQAIPADMRHLAAYITETDQSGPWLDVNWGWVQQAYAEIAAWNQEPLNQQIRALCLHRWPRFDKFYIEGKQGIIDDFAQALQQDYRWRSRSAASTPPAALDAQQPAAGAAQTAVEPAVEATVEEAVPPPPSAARPSTPRDAEAVRAANRAKREAVVQPYQVEWVSDQFPTRLLVGEVIDVLITIKNTGNLTWNWGGSHPFRLGYHYFRNRRQLPMSREQNLRTELPQDVAPGESITLSAHIALPSQPGNYTLELDMVHEGVTGFKEQGSKALTRWLIVEAPAPVAHIDANGVPQNGHNLPVPLFSDIGPTLPRNGVSYAHRNLEQIRYLVINHTGTDPQLSLKVIAQAHIRQGYPGIAYNFVIDGLGRVLKVSGLEEVVQPNQPWSGQGVNICLMGDFGEQPPTIMQLDAAGRLCAWLIQNLGLSAEAIVGLGELTQSKSPGVTFYRGPTWKELLLRQVKLNLASLSGGSNEEQLRQVEERVGQLQTENQELQNQLRHLQSEREKARLANEQTLAELAQLKQTLETQSEVVETGIRIHNRIDQLPRQSARYVERPIADVRYLVINQTGVGPDVPMEELARIHSEEWPGILYDYVIDSQGHVHQTQPLNQVVDTDLPYLAQAINVAFMGEFNADPPSDEQLYAGGQLISWLLQRFPNVSVENIKGLSEFIEHESPGSQWQRGHKWKEMLLASMRRSIGLYNPEQAEQELRDQIGQKEQQIRILQDERQAVRAQKLELEAEYQRLLNEMEEQAQHTTNVTVPEPAMRRLIDQLPRHPTLRYKTRSLSQVTHIAIHHTATPPTMTPQRIAELHINPDPSRDKEAWPGIGYHFFVHADGSIDQLNHLETVSYHVYRHNEQAVGVVFAGSFMNGAIPTSAQLRAGAHLVAWLIQEFKLPLARVWGHREFPDNTTVCPGTEWTQGNRWRDLLFERVEQIQSGVGLKSMRHYMLFWQRAYPGPLGQQDLVNAMEYVARFRPALGFSLNDAKNAEYVTIVGGESGISKAEEQLLRNAGCRVERIHGRSEEETGQMLNEMARLGRRFREFEVDF